MPIRLSADSDWIWFAVKVVPGASRDRIAGEYDGGLKITVAKAAQRGEANGAVVELLAEQLGVGEADVEIVRGHTSAWKMVRVRGITVEELRKRIG
jgi:uncharacterized protein (TIGR00251 family)